MNYLQTVLLSVVLASGIIVAINTDSIANEEVSPVKEIVKKEIVQYATERETHLYNKVEKTVDLPWFWDYQDLLASYAYNTCKKVVKDNWYYSCEDLVKTWNSENGWWVRNAVNDSNSNGTTDGWLCQLNSQRHMTFLKSKWFENPLAQLDYCLQVRQDAKKKGKMPWSGYHVRHKRDKGIKFKMFCVWDCEVYETQFKKEEDKWYLYDEAVKATKERQEAVKKEYLAWEKCKEAKVCKE